MLKGRKFAVFTNPSGIIPDGNSFLHITDFLKKNKLPPSAFLVPEHGIFGDFHHGVNMDDIEKDELFGIPAYYMHSPNLNYAKIMNDVDLIVYCIQEAGSAYYTYKKVMCRLIEHASENDVDILIIDKPNPLNGNTVEGHLSNYNAVKMPVRHAMTDGEIASFLVTEKKIHTNVTVLKFPGWKRKMWFDESGLVWIPPSTALPTTDSTLLYSGLCILQHCDVSLGRGTYTPFGVIAAPGINGRDMAVYMNSLDLRGVYFSFTRFFPNFDKFANEKCEGIRIHILDRNKIRPYSIALHALDFLYQYYPEKITDKKKTDYIPDEFGKISVGEILEKAAREINLFNSDIRTKHLFY
jgi:uncharacterized protein YbbC (DUF1343 family)